MVIEAETYFDDWDKYSLLTAFIYLKLVPQGILIVKIRQLTVKNCK